MAWIAIDLGTTGCRSLIFDERLQIVGESYYEYPLITLSDLAIEQDRISGRQRRRRILREL